MWRTWHQLNGTNLDSESPGCSKEAFHRKQERVSPLALPSPQSTPGGDQSWLSAVPGKKAKKKKKKAKCLHTCDVSAPRLYRTCFKALDWVGAPGINVLSKSSQALQPLPRSCVCARKPGVCGLDSALIQLSQLECFPEELWGVELHKCSGVWETLVWQE